MPASLDMMGFPLKLEARDDDRVTRGLLSLERYEGRTTTFLVRTAFAEEGAVFGG